MSKHNKHIGRWPQLWNLHGILAATETCSNMLSPRKHIASTWSSNVFNLLEQLKKEKTPVLLSWEGLGCHNFHVMEA